MRLPSLHEEKQLFKKGYETIAGVDEVGRGPLAGPVVACAIILPENFYIKAIRDSKKCTPKRREELYKKIIKKCRGYALGMVESDVIDRINIWKAGILAMRRAIQGLKIEPDYLLIDGRSTVPGQVISQHTVIRGDGRVTSIACASIIAKVTRDHIMQEYHKKYPEYRFDLHKGYGTKLHQEMLIKYGPSPIHRISFQFVKSLDLARN